MEKKVLFLDLDATLLNDEKQVTDGNRRAINRMLSEGHVVVINTGRHIVSAKLLAKEIGLDKPGCFLISFNGGLIYDFSKNEAIYKQPIPLEDVRRVFHEAKRRGVHIQTFDSEYVLVDPHNDDEYIGPYCSSIHMEYRVVPSAEAIVEEPIKMLAIEGGDHKKVQALERWILEEENKSLDAFFSNPMYLEIVRKGLNKSNGMLRLCEYLSIPLESTIAAGDMANDIPMLKTAHIGACMINGSDEAKAAANYITTRDNNHDGVAEIIEKFVFGK